MPVLTDGWRETVADRATEYVTKATWHELFRARARRRCKVLADGAAKILQGTKMAHQLVGKLAAWIVSFFTGDRIVQTFTRELASNIPLPYEARVVAVARAIQITGILLCLVKGEDLTQCQCFIDLALVETKTMVKKILLAGLSDWTGLADFPPKDATSQAPRP